MNALLQIPVSYTHLGYSALLETRTPAGEAPEGRPATLDEIMIHLEQEAK